MNNFFGVLLKRGPAGPAGPAGETGPAGPAGETGPAGVSDILILQPAVGSTWTAGVFTAFPFTTFYTNTSDLTNLSNGTITINTPGLYKVNLNVGFTDGSGPVPGDVYMWADIKDADGSTIQRITQGTGGQYSSGTPQQYVNAGSNWTINYTFGTNTNITFSSFYAPNFNSDITRIV
jgi:hypothetical protein